VDQAQQDGVLLLRNGAPAAVILGVAGMDQEQIELGFSERFWKLIAVRRQERTLSRAQLEQKMSGHSAG
jgi:hypothetical protein